MLRTLLIDNYDSYSYNLFQLLAQVGGVEPIVSKNDAISLDGVRALLAEGKVHNIVISPGPGSPDKPADIGVNLEVLQQLPHVPILGVCLGHQALAVAAGGRIVRAPEPVHGRISELSHSGHALLDSIPSGPGQGFDVVRYHSLVVDPDTLPDSLETIAWTTGSHHAVVTPASAAGHADPQGTGAEQENAVSQQGIGAAQHSPARQQGLIMALAHRTQPHWGLQFHPESICTKYGMQLLVNFHRMSCQHLGRDFPLPRGLQMTPVAPGCAHSPRPWPSVVQTTAQPLGLVWRRCPHAVTPRDQHGSQALFESLVGWQDHTFWLDSAATDRGRYSFMGAKGGPLWRCITYCLPPPGVIPAPSHPGGVATPHEDTQEHAGLLPLPGARVTVSPGEAAGAGTVRVEDGSGGVTTCRIPFFSYLRQLLRSHQLQVPPAAAEQLPFNFWGGLVGYLGYELKAECGGVNAHASPTPDAALLFADRLVAVDHWTGDVYALAVYAQPGHVHGDTSGQHAAQAWVDSTAAQVEARTTQPRQINGHSPAHGEAKGGGVGSTGGAVALQPGAKARTPQPFRLRHNKRAYMHNIQECISALYAGDSYEVCLTTALLRQGAPRPPTLYKTLRALNPAPYAAWLHFGTAGPTLCCSSPERFLRGDRGGVLEARPIKGTAARHVGDAAADARAAQALASSEKDRAENLMIVDLLRNDLGAVCEVGSVHVPGLMEIESYATVHQMVSTVQGVRRASACLVDCIQAAFPAGSMTGAPKVRTMSIIDELEGGARGVYSGCIGFISLNDCFDLNVVIRTLTINTQPRADTHAPGGSPALAGAVRAAACAEDGWDTGAVVSIGAGGAIVVQSEVEAEFAEMRLKARALLAALGQCDGTLGPAQLDDEHTWGQ